MQVLDDRIVPSFLTTLASTKADGTQVSSNSLFPALSADGRFVAFVSDAKLTADDTNAFQDVYRKDRMTGTVTLVSRADGANGAAGNGGVDSTASPSISADGRYVAFSSFASNLAGTDNNGQRDVFVRDTVAGTTTLVSVDGLGNLGNGNSTQPHISGNGQFVTFLSTSINLVAGSPAGTNLFHRDLLNHTIGRIGSQASANAISADGRYVAFDSEASDLASGDTNGQSDVFLHDRATGTTTRVSTNASGTGSNGASGNVALSGNGRFVAFCSASNDLVSGDANGQSDVFVKDRVTGAVTRVSVSTAGAEGNSFSGGGVAISRDGQFVAYRSNATSLAPDANGGSDVFVTQRPLPASYVAGTGPGGSNVVNVYDAAGTVKTTVSAYPAAYTGGVFVALGDASGDGIDEVVTSTGPGGTANIRMFSQNGTGGALLASFFAYVQAFTGGVRVAVADVDGDGFADVITGVGSGGEPNVRVFNARKTILVTTLPASPTPDSSVFALPRSFTGGMFVSAGDVNNDGVPDLLIGVESGGGPNVRAYSLNNLNPDAPLQSFFAFASNSTGGVKVAGTDLNQDGYDDFVTGTGPGDFLGLNVFSGKTQGLKIYPSTRSGPPNSSKSASTRSASTSGEPRGWGWGKVDLTPRPPPGEGVFNRGAAFGEPRLPGSGIGVTLRPSG